MKLGERIKHAWNVFTNEDIRRNEEHNYGNATSYPGYRSMNKRYSSSEIASKVFNRIAMDVSMTDIIHSKVNFETGNHTHMKSGIQNCLQVEANMDQNHREFIHDVVYSMFDEGVVAIVPTDTDLNPLDVNSFDILSLRAARISQWYPDAVEVQLYNEATGLFQPIRLPKSKVAIIENPLYAITNASNGVLSRLTNKMTLLDTIDEQRGSKRMNLILQLPYTVKGSMLKERADARLKSIENQMQNSQYGIAYVDGTEKITQLNRPLDNNILEEIQYLTEQFYNQMGLTPSVFNGTASELEMRIYYTRTIDPIVERIIAELRRKFLTKTARSQGQTFVAYRDPFKLLLTEQIADIGDKMRRNEVLTSNEVRKIIGFHPSMDPKADTLQNPNMPVEEQQTGSASSPDKIKMDAKIDKEVE